MYIVLSVYVFLFYTYCDTRDLPLLTHSLPTRRSSDLSGSIVSLRFVYAADANAGIVDEDIPRNLEILRRRTFADTARGIVDRTVARAEPAAIFTLMAERHATEMGADADGDQTLRLLDAVRVLLRVAQVGGVVLAGIGVFRRGAMVDENQNGRAHV